MVRWALPAMDTLAHARTLLPLWVRVAPWLIGPALALLGFVAARAVLSVPDERRGADGQAEPWWERARVVFPVRQLGFSLRVLSLAVGFFAAITTMRGWVSPAEGRFTWTVLLAWAGPLMAALRFEARQRRRPFRDALRSWAALGAVSYSGVYVIVLLGEPSSAEGPLGWALAVGGVGLVLWLTSGGGLALASWLGLARPAPERVQAAVARASKRLSIPYRAVLELDSYVANALAFPLARRIVFTRAAAEAMDDDELEAIAAHELGHVAEPLVLRLFRPAVIVVVAAGALLVPKLSLSTAALAGTLGAALLVLLVARRLVRKAEQHADSHAKDETGVYARALEKVYALNLVPAVLRHAGAHGHLYDRLVEAGRPPSWPRPPPPERAPLRKRLLLVAVIAAVPALVLLGDGARAGTRDEALVALALGNASGWTVEVLARGASVEGRFDDALVLYRVARALSPGEPFLTGALVVALCNAGACDEARIALEKLEAQVVGLDLRSDEEQALELARRSVEGCWGR